MRIFSASLIVVVLLLPIACAPAPPDMAALRKTVDAYNDASKAALLSGDAQKDIAWYEADALEMAPNMTVIKGRDSIFAFQQSMAKTGMKATAVDFQTTELTADGKMAYEIGTYSMSMTMPSGEMNDKGKYIALWRQQTDGTWKVHAETWNSDMPMQMPSAPKEAKGKKK
ncbi:MAG TPA: DUF4440 domain-containing protein [Bacteroidota bacterium]|nr:DUF4440 domain-containing protein [Bacteroidota bacterium]